jgi:hypothetical protein
VEPGITSTLSLSGRQGLLAGTIERSRESKAACQLEGLVSRQVRELVHEDVILGL